MTWKTIYTDGRIFADKDFMDMYHDRAAYMNEGFFQDMATGFGIELKEAKIKKADPIEYNQFRQYDIEGDEGIASLIMRENLSSVVKKVLGVTEEESVVGIVVQAFYKNRTLRGFRAMPNLSPES